MLRRGLDKAISVCQNLAIRLGVIMDHVCTSRLLCIMFHADMSTCESISKIEFVLTCIQSQMILMMRSHIGYFFKATDRIGMKVIREFVVNRFPRKNGIDEEKAHDLHKPPHF